MDVITDFLQSEIDTKEHYRKIIHFITSYEIRKGKFKGNKYIIEKINRDSFMLYIEYQDIQGKIMYTPSIAPIISQNRLIEFIEEYIKNKKFEKYYVSRKNFFGKSFEDEINKNLDTIIEITKIQKENFRTLK